MNLDNLLDTIQPLCKESMEQSQIRWNKIAKPLHSLGKLEDAIINIAGIIGSSQVELKKKALIIMCADNGVVEEGVTQTGQEVTKIVSENFMNSKTSATVMAHQVGCDIFPVDIGIATDSCIINEKIAYGTNNIMKGPAMTRDETLRALEVGIRQVERRKQEGYQIICTGEMGIGNTTTSSAVASVLLQKPVEEVTGKGAGLSREGILHKIEVIKKSIELNKPNPADPIDVLAKVGGFDIAGLVGIFLGGAIYRVPIIIDGFISGVAALIACRIHPLVVQYMLPSHVSKEEGGRWVLEALGKEAFLTCDMCLGEGTGAVALMPLLDLSLAVYNSMSTFEQIQVEEYKEL